MADTRTLSTIAQFARSLCITVSLVSGYASLAETNHTRPDERVDDYPSNWQRQKANGGLGGREKLNVLEKEGQKSFHRVECAWCRESAVLYISI